MRKGNVMIIDPPRLDHENRVPDDLVLLCWEFVGIEVDYTEKVGQSPKCKVSLRRMASNMVNEPFGEHLSVTCSMDSPYAQKVLTDGSKSFLVTGGKYAIEFIPVVQRYDGNWYYIDAKAETKAEGR